MLQKRHVAQTMMQALCVLAIAVAALSLAAAIVVYPHDFDPPAWMMLVYVAGMFTLIGFGGWASAIFLQTSQIRELLLQTKPCACTDQDASMVTDEVSI